MCWCTETKRRTVWFIKPQLEPDNLTSRVKWFNLKETNLIFGVRFYIPTTSLVKSEVLQNVTLCGLISHYRHFGEAYCHLTPLGCLTLKIHAVITLDMTVTLYQSVRRLEGKPSLLRRYASIGIRVCGGRWSLFVLNVPRAFFYWKTSKAVLMWFWAWIVFNMWK